MGAAIGRTLLAAIHPAILAQSPIVVEPLDDTASAGEWLYLAALVVMTVVLIAMAVVATERNVNPHTGLRGK
jgi:hypothetical protein